MKKFNILGIFLLVFLISGIVIGCSNDDIENSVPSGEGIEIQHSLGETILDSIPERVIVFDYGILDGIEELGLGDKVIGLPKSSVPEYLDKYKGDEYEDIGTLQEPNFELIYELQPDLIIISDRQADAYDEFEEIAPTFFISIMDGEYMDLFEKNMMDLGKIFGVEDEVEEKIIEVKEDVVELNSLAQEKVKNALFLMANDGELSVYGKGSRFGVVYNEFGLEAVDDNIDDSTHGQKISYEYLIEKDPEYIFVMDRGQIAGADINAKDVMENELIEKIQAYKNDNIVYLDSPIWYVASGGIKSTKMMVEDIFNGIK